jgi:Outer membrane lipoprotein-sorting protein
VASARLFPLVLGAVRFGIFFILGLVLFTGSPSSASAQSRLNRPAPRYLQGTPDQNEGAKILRELRAAGPVGDYYLEFQLRELPRRGHERRTVGRLWGTRTAEGPLTRLSLNPLAEAKTEATLPLFTTPETRLLIQGGPRPCAWLWSAADATAGTLDPAGLFRPLGGTGLTAFDVQMPFLYWADFVYEGTTRLFDRPVDTFLLYPPSDILALRPDLAALRVYLDPNYHALVQAEQIGLGGRILKSFRVVSLAKIEDVWLPKSFEIRDETTRDKTRLVITSAALKRDFSSALFAPAALAESIQPPAPLTRLAE